MELDRNGYIAVRFTQKNKMNKSIEFDDKATGVKFDSTSDSCRNKAPSKYE